MRRMTVERAQARPRALKLQCPECTHAVRVARDELVESGTAYCRNCGCEAELTLGLDGGTGKTQWMLLDPLADDEDDDEERLV